MIVSLLTPSSLFFAIQISFLVTVQGSTIIIAGALGGANVAVFVGCRTLVNLIPQAIGTVTGALWPELTSLEARGNRDALRQAHQLLGKLALTFAGCAAVFMHFVAPDIVRIWTGGRLQYDPALGNLLLLTQVVVISYAASATVLASSNNHRTLAASYLCASALGLALGAWLVGPLGLAGMGVGLLVAEVATDAWIIPRNACAVLGERWREFAAGQVRRAGMVVAPVYVLLRLASGSVEDWPAGHRLIALSMLAVLSIVPLIWFLTLDPAERARARAFAPRVQRLSASRGNA